MKDSEPPNDICLLDLKKFDILTNPLEKTIELCQNAMNWADGFVRSNSNINKDNLLEYNTLWEDLCVIHKSAIHMANEDPMNYLKNDRSDIRKKRDYANRLQKLIRGRKHLLDSIGEVESFRKTLKNGSYKSFDLIHAQADY